MSKNQSSANQLIKYTAIVIVVLVLLVIGWISSLLSGDESNSKNQNTETSQAAESEEPKSTEITESDAEKFCQDAALIGKHLRLKETAIISILDYNKHFLDDGATFAKDGTPIKMLKWNGKDKTTDELIGFNCWISGTPDKITLHSLSANGKELEGSLNFESYNKDGELLE